MTFADPLLLLTLLAVPAAVVLYGVAQRRRMRYAVGFTNIDVLSRVVGRQWRRHVPPALFVLALLLICFAVARPQLRTLATTEGKTVILVVDASLSMRATDVKPSRLAAAQTAVRSFLDRVPPELRVGLVVFSGEAQVGAPPATDRDVVRESVDSIGSSGAFGGTAIGDALVLAVELAGRAVGTTRGLASILFLSDGRQNEGNVQPLEAARRARQAGMRVYTVALGTDHARLPVDLDGLVARSQSLAPDPGTLKAIARITGGEFFRARSAGALQSAYAGLGRRLGGRPSKSEITYAFLAVAGAFLLGSTLLSVLWSPRLP